MRSIGTVSMGVRAPIVKKGDDLAQIVVDSIASAVEHDGVVIKDHDVIGVTEAVLARTQGNYATTDQIAKDVKNKFDGEVVGLILPILSRNRFSMLLKGIAKGVKKLVIQLSYPSDEVGNPLISLDRLDEKGIDPYVDVLTEKEFRDLFGHNPHPFTGVDYIDYYKQLAGEFCECEVILANNPKAILKYTDQVIVASIHSRFRTKKILLANGASKVFGLDEILTESVDGSGFHPQYGLLGSNLATEDSVKLFPRDAQPFVERVQKLMVERFGKLVEVMVYGDGAFKDPVGGIWELADPVVSPGYTKGLEGQPNELKLKYLADNALKDLEGEEAKEAMIKLIKEKEDNLVNNIVSQGTTPRRLTDLLGSLCDLTSGSGDKGTPFILIQGYFDNYAS